MKFRVFMTVHGTAVVEVEAKNRAHAMERANDEFAEAGIPVCHQCSDQISDPSYGTAVEACPA